MTWQEQIAEEWKRRRRGDTSTMAFPLNAVGFDDREIVAAVDVLLSGRITMGPKTALFEERFAERVGAKYAVMVNSGSSANLLAVAAMTNHERPQRLFRGNRVLVPAVCWSTSVWPLVQAGLEPVFVDVDPKTLNMDVADAERRQKESGARAVMAVHILGNAAPNLRAFADAHDLFLIEDTCEALGSAASGRYLGTQGDFGTYSFYYSHHITTGEGGMVVCKTKEDQDLLRCLRAHGWSRGLSNAAELEAAHPDVDPRFLFVNVGYNVRPTEMQAAFGLRQLERLHVMNDVRNSNRYRLCMALMNHPEWAEQFTFPSAPDGVSPAWFGFPALLSEECEGDRAAYLRHLTSRGVENRPVVSGNFLRQPALQALGISGRPEDFPGAEAVHKRGFFVGLPSEPVDDSSLKYLASILLMYPWSGR